MNDAPSTVFVVPAPGLVVRDPLSREALPEAGKAVPCTTYWLRRLADGDVTEGAPTHAPAKAKP